jgi:hypothetical protein
MEPTMISFKVLSSAAAMALVLSLAPSASFAQNPGKAAFAARGGGGAPAARTGGGGPRMSGGAPAARFSGGGPRMGGGEPAARFSGGGPRMGGGGAVAQVGGNRGAMAQYQGGGYRGGYAGGYRRGGNGFIPGAVAGAVIGGALASDSYAYYGGPAYGYGPGSYDDQYYDDGGAVAVVQAPVGGDDSGAYCAQTYRSYDPASGTYLGYDGLRHPCP